MPPSHSLTRTVYAGTFIHVHQVKLAKVQGPLAKLQVRENTLVGVNEHGKIVTIASLHWSQCIDETDGGRIHRGPARGLPRQWEALEDEFVESMVEGWPGWGKRITTGTGSSTEEIGSDRWKLVRARKDEWWFPGFVDTHIHASQYPSAGIFGESTLLDWLQKYIYPLEASLVSVPKAELVYSQCVATTLRHGTTTATYYATIHVPSTNRLADICLEAGQRAFIGRCNMDSDLSPDDYRDASPDSAIEDTRATIAHIAHRDPKHHLVTPIITPRYAPSCSPTLLCALGALAKETNLPVQTHISENSDEVALVRRLFPDQDSYAGVYDYHGLLTRQTVLGHAVHLTPDEHKLISKRGAKVAHCPVSNSSLSSGLCPVRKLLNAGIEVGLGTDVSGGWSPSVLAAAREAATVSRILASVERDSASSEVKTEEDCGQAEEKGNDPHGKTPPPSKTVLTVEECLYLATVGGACCLGLSQKIGRFDVGMEWDAQLVNLGPALDLKHTDDRNSYTRNQRSPGGPVQLWGKETWEEKLAKWVFGGDDRNTLAVWVRGRLVHCRPEYFDRDV